MDTGWVWVFLGRLHPLVVHFPIALLLFTASVETFRFWRRKPMAEGAVGVCLILGAAGAGVAALFGWVRAADPSEFSGRAADILEIHRWLGIAVVLISIAAVVLSFIVRKRKSRSLFLVYLSALLLSAAVVGAGGHYGGMLVFGEDYLTSALPFLHAKVDVAAAKAPAGTVDFVRDVQPIFQKACLDCHGPKDQKGDLRLDAKHLAVRGGKGKKAILPGDGPASAVVSRMLGQDGKSRMPMNADPLPADQIALIRAWIDQGAVWDDSASVKDAVIPMHWAYEKPVHARPPDVKNKAWVRNPIDAFILARLEKEGIEPAPEASREALLRRATFDLTGLPPTPEEMDAFLKDTAADAYEKVIDRLLASPHYGERWGRHWLDVVRFGESHGYEQNHLRLNAWPYRDYVIRAFNEDKPYTDFVSEQLAGDILGARDPRIAAATGFLVAGVHDTVPNQTEQGTRQQRANDLDDIVSTTGATFLGLTVGCARCHDHKFDPILQKDYYALAAAFADVRHLERPIPPFVDAVGEEEEAGIARRIRFLSARISDLDAQAREIVLRSQGVDPAPRPAVNVQRNVEDFAPVAARFVRLTILATQGGNEPCIDELEVFAPGGTENLALAAKGAKASASSLLPGYPIHQIRHLNDGRFGNAWSWISNEPGQGWAQIELSSPATLGRVVWARSSLDQPDYTDRLASRYLVELSLDGRVWRLVATGEDRAASAEAIPPGNLLAALTPDLQKERAAWAAEREDLRQRLSGRPPQAYIGRFDAPDTIHLLKRGDVMNRAEVVPPGTFTQLPGLSSELPVDPGPAPTPPRLALARWIADPGNPLTVRVIINRVWHYHFGRGIVPTPSDFGINGVRPSHPELLDWLANDFTANGWRLKRLHRFIMLSGTYRQSGRPDPKGEAVDAGNRLLWRMPLRRLEAEAVRDSILAVSGKLNPEMGGPGFPLFKYEVVNVAHYDALEDYGPETWRRSAYRLTPRGYIDNLLGCFDAPEAAMRSPRREASTTPFQALNLLNGAFVVRQAEFFAERVAREAGAEPAAQVGRAFRLAYGRPPDAAEEAEAVGLVRKHGLPALCRALFNTNEFLHY